MYVIPLFVTVLVKVIDDAALAVEIKAARTIGTAIIIWDSGWWWNLQPVGASYIV